MDQTHLCGGSVKYLWEYRVLYVWFLSNYRSYRIVEFIELSNVGTIWLHWSRTGQCYQKSTTLSNVSIICIHWMLWEWNSMKCPIQVGIIYQAQSDNYHKRRTGSVPSRAPRCHALWHPPARSTATPGMLCTSRSCGIWIASDRISMERHGKFAPQWLWYQWWSMVVKNVWNRSGQIWSDKSSLPFPFWGQIGQIV